MEVLKTASKWVFSLECERLEINEENEMRDDEIASG